MSGVECGDMALLSIWLEKQCLQRSFVHTYTRCHQNSYAGAPQTVCYTRRRIARSASFEGSEGDILVPMEAMGEAYNRLANHGRVGSAIKAGSA